MTSDLKRNWVIISRKMNLLTFQTFLLFAIELIRNASADFSISVFCSSMCRIGKGGNACKCKGLHFPGKRQESPGIQYAINVGEIPKTSFLDALEKYKKRTSSYNNVHHANSLSPFWKTIRDSMTQLKQKIAKKKIIPIMSIMLSNDDEDDETSGKISIDSSGDLNKDDSHLINLQNSREYAPQKRGPKRTVRYPRLWKEFRLRENRFAEQLLKQTFLHRLVFNLKRLLLNPNESWYQNQNGMYAQNVDKNRR